MKVADLDDAQSQQRLRLPTHSTRPRQSQFVPTGRIERRVPQRRCGLLEEMVRESKFASAGVVN